MMHEPASTPLPPTQSQSEAQNHERFLSSHSPPLPVRARVKKPRSSRRELRALMDQKGVDAEGGHGGPKGRWKVKLALVVAVQNLLVLACLLGFFYIYMELQSTPEDVVHIKFNYLGVSSGNSTVHFQNPESCHRMKVSKFNVAIHVECTGPYVWYIDNCKIQKEKEETSGVLQLRVQGSDTPVSSFTLNSTHICRGLHSITYLRAKEVASVHLNSEGFMIDDMSMGLTYLLGNKCEY